MDMRDRLVELIRQEQSCYSEDIADYLLENGVIVLPCKCQDCVYSVPLDNNCELNTGMYLHCTLGRGEETKNIWHKYKKYYKDYSIVDRGGFCDSAEKALERSRNNARDTV